MTQPTPLSPAALAVWEAFRQFDEAGMHVDYGVKLSAALRAVADQVTSAKAMLQLYAIAAELEAQ